MLFPRPKMMAHNSRNYRRAREINRGMHVTKILFFCQFSKFLEDSVAVSMKKKSSKIKT